MNPTREQVIAWAQQVGVPSDYIKAYAMLIEAFAALSYAAGRNAGLERAAEVCESESSDPEVPAIPFDDHANGWASACDYCAKAIRALKGEKE